MMATELTEEQEFVRDLLDGLIVLDRDGNYDAAMVAEITRDMRERYGLAS